MSGHFIDAKAAREALSFRIKSLRACGLHDVARQIEDDMKEIFQTEIFVTIPEPIALRINHEDRRVRQ